MKKKIIPFSLLLFWGFVAVCQGKWELKRDESGIKVFTRNTTNSDRKEVRVICELDATRAQLVSTLLDIGNYKTWVYANEKAVLLKTLGPKKIIFYTQSHLPWPVKDRDLVVELNIAEKPNGLNIEAKSLPGYLPKNKNFVRVPYSLEVWNVTAIPNNKLKADYTFSFDSGGSVPAWLANTTLTTGPFNSFVKLRELLRGKYAR